MGASKNFKKPLSLLLITAASRHFNACVFRCFLFQFVEHGLVDGKRKQLQSGEEEEHPGHHRGDEVEARVLQQELQEHDKCMCGSCVWAAVCISDNLSGMFC